MFPRSSLERLLRIVRLSRDLGINLAGIAAVLDMRERIESLQKEVERLRGRL
jgi:MerR family transcriptional regulator, heat shock protein HspR